MRFTAAAACLIVSIDCLEKAAGDQTLFSPGAEWVWFIAAAIWVISAISLLVEGAA